MALNIFAKDVTLRVRKKAKLKTRQMRSITPSDKLTGIELRILPPYVKDNNTAPFLGLPGLAKVYCVIVVVSDAKNQLAGDIDLQGFPRIGDKEHLPINKTIFYWQKNETDNKAPTQIHIAVTVIKSKKALREFGDVLKDLKNDEAYKGIVKQVTDLARNTTAVSVGINLVTQLSSIVGKYLGHVEDKPLGTFVNSYTALYGDFDKQGVARKSYPTKKVDFEAELIVRNAEVAETTSVKTVAKKSSAKKTAGKKSSSVQQDGDPVKVDMKKIV